MWSLIRYIVGTQPNFSESFETSCPVKPMVKTEAAPSEHVVGIDKIVALSAGHAWWVTQISEAVGQFATRVHS